ncbi:MAG: DUF1826 domain-containing protein [Paracoccaceae bacterium]
MTLVRETVANAAVGVGVADTAEGLNAFLRPGCAAAIWRKEMPSDVERWLGKLDPDRLPRGRILLPPDSAAATVAQLCDIARMPEGPERTWLQSDIVDMVDMFTTLLPVKMLRLRLDVVTTNACRKFHIDAVNARLVCTYRGTGTQYGVSRDGADPAHVFTVPTGSPILLRGTLWPTQPASGLLHRSPPIEGTGETRLVLVLDPIFDPGEGVEATLAKRVPKRLH